jgi:GWxTD domain-containing protein
MKMETMNSKIIWPWAILAVLLLAGCYSTERLSEQNLAYIYDRKATVLSPSFRVRHLNDTVSVLDFRIPSNELLYLQNATSGFFSAEFRMRYEIYGQLESRMLVDSAVVLFKDSVLSLTDRAIEGTLRFKPSRSKAGLLKIDLIDLKRNARVRQYIPIDRTSYNCRQFFNVLEADSAPLFSNLVSLQQKVVISHASGASEAKVRYYERDFPLPRPPFSMEEPAAFDYKADSTFSIPLGTPVNLSAIGMYHIQVNDSTREGLTLFRFEDGFPKVKEVDDLIAPLRYINSNQEFKKLTSADFPKAEVDRFWLSLAGNPERARILIEKYYSRVQDANAYFTSFTEGWRTDRGMVFLIFGTPNALYKTSNSEQWVYGEPSNPASVSFTFIKVNNPFTDNDYRLERSQLYKDSWFRAVDMWRQGRIYLDN